MRCQIFLMKFCCYFENGHADNGLLPFQLHSHDNPQKHLVIPQFEDSLTTKKLMPFSTYSLVIFSTKRKGRTHMNICTTKVHDCSVPRLDQNYSFNCFCCTHEDFTSLIILGFSLLWHLLASKNFQEFLEHMLELYAPLHILYMSN